MRFLILGLCLFSYSALAHEIQSTTQHLSLTRQRETGWQQDVSAKLTLRDQLDIGLQTTYLERFSFFEKRYGAFLIYRPADRWTFELRYLQGPGNQILPERQTQFTTYHALAEGISPFLTYRNLQYSVTHLNLLTVGAEIEKIPYFIFIPSASTGHATFQSPAKTNSVYNYGLRVTWYEEKKYGASVFGYKGREASQGIIGRSTILVDTLSAGLSAYYIFREELKTELIFDHTNYDQLKTQFLTTTLNLTWMF